MTYLGCPECGMVMTVLEREQAAYNYPCPRCGGRVVVDMLEGVKMIDLNKLEATANEAPKWATGASFAPAEILSLIRIARAAQACIEAGFLADDLYDALKEVQP